LRNLIMIPRNKRKPYTLAERVRMAVLKKQGLSNRQIAFKMKRSRQGVDYMLRKLKERGSLLPRKQPGAPMKFTDEMLHEVTLQMKRGRILVLPDIVEYVHREFNVRVSRSCVRHRLSVAGFQPYTQLKKPLLTDNQKKKRLQQARKWLKEGEKYWEFVVFTD